MSQAGRAASGAASWLRWVGRILGTAAAAFWLLMGVTSALAGPDPWTVQSTVLAFLIAGSAAGAGIAWWREDIGGIVLLASGIGHSIFGYLVSGHHRYTPILIAGLPFLLAGVLVLMAWRLMRARSN